MENEDNLKAQAEAMAERIQEQASVLLKQVRHLKLCMSRNDTLGQVWLGNGSSSACGWSWLIDGDIDGAIEKSITVPHYWTGYSESIIWWPSRIRFDYDPSHFVSSRHQYPSVTLSATNIRPLLFPPPIIVRYSSRQK